MRIRWTEPAANDLTGICDYTEEHDGPQAARPLALRIYEGVNSLAEFPLRGRPGRKEGTRELVFPPVCLASKPHDDVPCLDANRAEARRFRALASRTFGIDELGRHDRHAWPN